MKKPNPEVMSLCSTHHINEMLEAYEGDLQNMMGGLKIDRWSNLSCEQFDQVIRKWISTRSNPVLQKVFMSQHMMFLKKVKQKIFEKENE